MPLRTCAYNKYQDGVCGCPTFWKRKRAKSRHPRPDRPNTSNDDAIRDAFKKVVGKASRHVHVSGPSADPWSRVEGFPYKSMDIGQPRRSSNQPRKKKKKRLRKPKVLVDYDLPSGEERLDWDTDEVRRMVGEIT
ncbi:hypothetical protein BDW02DRAFT_600224 [Decorospora gaudefroyi]|uniref:Uncharacterized protein n=1 Tax=Decorospora gaudefroyi TaxID=184978 RepID=A0A6A5KCK7_9PLEO|nr:hypothetical protein BDW02DRAFT_600224 [Decorospora gaudefroyi]